MRIRFLRAGILVFLLSHAWVAGCGGGGASSGEVSPPLPVPATPGFTAVGSAAGTVEPNAVLPLTDNGFLVAGRTVPAGGNNGDAWIAKADSGGQVLWQYRFGGTGEDAFAAATAAGGGDTVLAGITWSAGAGKADVLVLRVGPSGTPVWQKTYGSSGSDIAGSIRTCPDGGFILAGHSESFGNSDQAWVLKLGSDGAVQWQKAYGGTGDDWAHSVRPAGDGGYIVAGTTWSFEAGKSDAWVLKLTADGTVQWERRIGGPEFDDGYDVLPLAGGGYLLAGATRSFGSGGTGPGGTPNPDAWLVRFDASGAVVWQKTYGGTGMDEARTLALSSDDMVLVAGYTSSFGPGKSDMWMWKVDPANGNVLWQRKYGGAFDDIGRSVAPLAGGGIIIAGTTVSFGVARTSTLAVGTADNGAVVSSLSGIGIPTSAVPATSTATAVATASAVIDTLVTPLASAFTAVSATSSWSGNLTDITTPRAGTPFLLGLESATEVTQVGGTVYEVGTGAEVMFEPGYQGNGARFRPSGTSKGMIFVPGSSWDYADLDNDGGRLEFWLKFNFDPHQVGLGNKFVLQSNPYVFSAEFYGTTPFLSFEFFNNSMNPKTNYRFMVYATSSWDKWANWVQGEWHKITLTWKRNEGDGNVELHLYIDDTQAGCPVNQCNDYFGYLPEAGIVQDLRMGNILGGTYAIDFMMDSVGSFGADP
ncbi:MAG: hypothetical protein ACYC7J_20280 [Syntrophales bacterium]